MDNKEMDNKEREISLEEVADEMLTETKEDSKAVKFLKRVLAGAIDQIISISIALVLLVVFDLILKLIGLYIAEREPMFLIMYVIVNILYRPICSSTKLKETIGTKLMIK